MKPITTPPPPVPPERLRHVQHEALLRRDFDTQSALDDQVRWWHNRAVHNTYGIVAGLEVALDGEELVVQSGLAYDAFGRELLLVAPWRGPLPDAQDPQVLVLTRADDVSTTCTPPPAGWCRVPGSPGGAVTVQWQPLAGFTVHNGVVLSTWSAKAGPDTAGRIYTRAVARPRLGHGATVPGATVWTPWFERIDDTIWFLGLQVHIDTSAAGFTDAPCYFAQLNGAMWNENLPGQLLLPFPHIATPGKDAFTYRLLAPWLYRAREDRASAVLRARALYGSGRRFAAAFRGFANITALAVSWIGIQQQPTAPGAYAGRVIGGRGAVH